MNRRSVPVALGVGTISHRLSRSADTPKRERDTGRGRKLVGNRERDRDVERSGRESIPGYPTKSGVQLGDANSGIHPRETVEFTDDAAELRCTRVAAAVCEHECAVPVCGVCETSPE